MKRINQIILVLLFLILFSSCAVESNTLELTEFKETIEIGDSFRIRYNVDPSDAKVSFKVEDSSIASVSVTGIVKGLKEGTTIVTISLVDNPDVEAWFTLNVVTMLDSEKYTSAPFDEELWPIKEIEKGSDEEVLFLALKKEIAKIARSDATSTIINLTGLKLKSLDHFDDRLNRVVGLVWLSSPFDMYWYEEASGCYWYWKNNDTTVDLTIKFNVSSDYKKSQYEVDPSKKPIALKALEAANQIAASATGSDYDKIKYFKDKICELVTYDNNAYKDMASGKIKAGSNPWQMISVFDNNSSTNVVCAGYAKAFKYLCDKAGIPCILINGDVQFKGTSREAHLWNVVTIDGKNYIVDVTNCDTNSVGAPSKLMLVGAIGSIEEGYTDLNTETKYYYSLLGGGYDMAFLFSEESLTISDKSYTK